MVQWILCLLSMIISSIELSAVISGLAFKHATSQNDILFQNSFIVCSPLRASTSMSVSSFVLLKFASDS